MMNVDVVKPVNQSLLLKLLQLAVTPAAALHEVPLLWWIELAMPDQ